MRAVKSHPPLLIVSFFIIICFMYFGSLINYIFVCSIIEAINN
nr:MAG TPA: hypothetical protein [Bacteriophage sp.]